MMPKLQKIQKNCATKLKVLADSTRLFVVRELLGGARSVSQLNASLDIEQSLLSHHLRVLRAAGLVTSERDGKSVLYQLAPSFNATADGETLSLGCCALLFPRQTTATPAARRRPLHSQ